MPRGSAAQEPEPPSLSIADVRLKEGAEGESRSMVFTITLSDTVELPVSVRVRTEDGSATVAGADYLPLDLGLTLLPGSTTDSVSVTLLGDGVIEGNEWFHVRLSEPVDAALADSDAFGIILNDDRTVFGPVVDQVPPYTQGTLPNAWGDYDGDGLPDLPLYRSTGGGKLAEIPGFRALLDQGNYHGAAWCDYDRDGDLDMVVLGYADGEEGGFPTPSRLLRNEGGGTFTDVAPELGMNIVGNGETPTWSDFDGDGWPDLFAPYYSHVYPFQSFLYRNNHDGTFTERAADAGVSLPGIPIYYRPEGAQAADWDDDGHVDLYCASRLFLNDGTGNFTDVRAQVGLPLLFDEGAQMVDFDNDGDLDLSLRSEAGPRLFNNRSGHFEEVTAEAGLPPLPLLWGDSWADAEGDGDMDLLLIPPGEHARLYLNQGDGTFERDTMFDLVHVPAELASWADVDSDGDVDFVVGGGYTRKIYLNLESQLLPPSQRPLRVMVLDEQGNQTAYGATVRLYQIGGPPGSTQTRVVDGGSGYLGQNDYRVFFGGVGSGAYALEVVYPSPAGTRIVVDSLATPILGPIRPGLSDNHFYSVFRDGGAMVLGPPVMAVGRPLPWLAPPNALGNPSPNPARSWVSFAIDNGGFERASVKITDVHGRVVRAIDLDRKAAGVRWDLRDAHGATVPTGVYFCRLEVDAKPNGMRKVLVMH